MELFNKLGKTASKTYQATKEKAVNLSEELKLKGKITNLKDKISEKYSEIGKKVYIQVKDNKDVLKDEIIPICEEISNCEEQISKLEANILAIKKVKKCTECGAELEIGASFCSKCGKKQEQPQDVDLNQEQPQDTKEAEVVSINNSQENKSIKTY